MATIRTTRTAAFSYNELTAGNLSLFLKDVDPGTRVAVNVSEGDQRDPTQYTFSAEVTLNPVQPNATV